MVLEIGNKSLKELTAENMRQIVIIEGCSPALEFWNEPEIIGFDNQMFSDTIVLDHVSHRKSDYFRSVEYTFFFDFKKFSFHYVRDSEKDQPNRQPNGQRAGLETLRYLIEQGFDVPLYKV